MNERRQYIPILNGTKGCRTATLVESMCTIEEKMCQSLIFDSLVKEEKLLFQCNECRNKTEKIFFFSPPHWTHNLQRFSSWNQKEKKKLFLRIIFLEFFDKYTKSCSRFFLCAKTKLVFFTGQNSLPTTCKFMKRDKR